MKSATLLKCHCAPCRSVRRGNGPAVARQREMVPETLAEIKRQLARLDDLLQDCLSLARVATSERTAQDLGAAVQAWAQEWLRPPAAGRVMLRVEDLEHLGMVPFHASTLRRALLNLVQNASMPCPGGTLTRCAARPRARTCSSRVRYWEWHPGRPAPPPVRAPAYDETRRHRAGPVYRPGNCGRACRAGDDRESRRSGDDLYPQPAACRSLRRARGQGGTYPLLLILSIL